MLLSTAGCGEKDSSDADPDNTGCKTVADRNSPNTDKYHLDGIFHILGVERGLPCPTELVEIPPCEGPIPLDNHLKSRVEFGSVC